MYSVETGELGKRLKARRTAAGQTIAAVAAQAGLSVPYIANLENGRGNPTVAALSALARALGVTLQVQLGEDAPPAVHMPDALAQFARSSRFTSAVTDINDRARCFAAMATMAALSPRELSEVDCHRLLDAILLRRM